MEQTASEAARGNILVSIRDPKTGHFATSLFGIIKDYETGKMIGTAADRAKWSLQCLKKGVETPFSSRHYLAISPWWLSLLGADCEDDFRPFLKRTIKGVSGGSKNCWYYETH